MVQLKIVSFQKKLINWPLKIAMQQINALKDQLKNIVPKKLVSLFFLPCCFKMYLIPYRCGTVILVTKYILSGYFLGF